jgi:hypothetical protein
MYRRGSFSPQRQSVNMELLTVKQLSEYIPRSSGAIRNLVLRQKIPYRKCGGRLMFEKTEIDQWFLRSEGLTLDQWLKRDNHRKENL